MSSAGAKPAKITASKLRADIYNILDQVIETGQPVEVDRKGVTVKILAGKGKTKKQKKEMDVIERLRAAAGPSLWIGDPNDIFHMDWLEEWREEWGIKE